MNIIKLICESTNISNIQKLISEIKSLYKDKPEIYNLQYIFQQIKH